MQLELTESQIEERDITVLLRAPLRAVVAEEAIPRGEHKGKWGKGVQSTSAAIRGLTPRAVDPGGLDS
jgi:hypothetical protein